MPSKSRIDLAVAPAGISGDRISAAIATGKRAGEEPKGADQQPDLKDRPVADEIAEPAEGQHQTGVGEDVGDDDPTDILKLEGEGLRDAGEGDVDGGIEGRQ